MHYSCAGTQVRSIAQLGTKGTVDSWLPLARLHFPSREDYLNGKIVGRAEYTFSGNENLWCETVGVIRLDDQSLDLVNMDLSMVAGDKPL